jgi:hypothetical protein
MKENCQSSTPHNLKSQAPFQIFTHTSSLYIVGFGTKGPRAGKVIKVSHRPLSACPYSATMTNNAASAGSSLGFALTNEAAKLQQR